MTKPRYLLELYKSAFKADFVCMGSQLTSIVKEMKAFPLNGICYMGDIDANFTPPFLKQFSGWNVKKIGTIDDLINFSSGVDQFLSGVFFIFTENQGEELALEYSTEDPQFRDFGDALIEVRAFDTTCFDIYSNNIDALNRISEHFGKAEIKENAGY